MTLEQLNDIKIEDLNPRSSKYYTTTSVNWLQTVGSGVGGGMAGSRLKSENPAGARPQPDNISGANLIRGIPRKNGHWDGEPGNSRWFSDKPEIIEITNGEGVIFRNGRVDFSDYKTSTFEVKGLDGTNADFGLIHKQMMKDFGFKTQKAVTDFLRSEGLSPHHSGVETIELVPTVLNSGVYHVGGAADLRNN